MGADCRLLSRAEAADAMPVSNSVRAALQSPHELRVESRTAIPRLAAWLAAEHGVTFRWSTRVTGIDLPTLETSGGRVEPNAP
jgi:glycine/D-amino acid oxidase-like deaminating enzyme